MYIAAIAILSLVLVSALCIICLTFHTVSTYIFFFSKINHIIQIYSGIPRGRVFDGELLYTIFEKLICLHLPTDCFMKISLHFTELSMMCV